MGGFGTASIAGPRACNEDAFIVRDLSASVLPDGGPTAFAAIFDGMGGHAAGEVASASAAAAAGAVIDRLLDPAATAPGVTTDPAALLSLIAAEADAAVRRAQAEHGGVPMGATFVGLLARPGHAWIGHIGDSRAYLLRGAEATPLTRDHSQVGRLIAEGVLTEEQAQAHPGRNVIDRALGFSSAGDPEIAEADLEPADVVLLCSDGLSTALTGERMALVVAAAAGLPAAAETLVAEALAAGTDDNTTAVLWSAEGLSPRLGETP